MESTNELSWKLEFKQEKPERFWQLVVIIALSPFIGFLLTGKVVLALLVPICLFVSTYEVWKGKRYLLNEVKAIAGFSEIRWEDVKRVDFRSDSIYLSPFEKPNRLEGTRGITLIHSETNREDVLNFVRSKVGSDVRFLEG